MAAPTDQDILDALRGAYLSLATGGVLSYTIYGRTVTKHQIKDIQEAIVFFERRIDAATQPGIGGGTLLVGFGDPV